MNYQPLIDRQLRTLIDHGYIRNADVEQINPASLNLRIGSKALVERPRWFGLRGSKMEPVDLSGTSKEHPLWIPPGAFVLTDVIETLHFPDTLEAQVVLRSSAARLGFDHAAAGYVDPGYGDATRQGGRLTLEFYNCRRWQRLPLYRGQQLVQLRIFRLSTTPERSYAKTGRYNGARQVEGNKDLGMSIGLT